MLTVYLFFTVGRKLKTRNQLPKRTKMKGKSFYSIIQDFKIHASEGEKKSEGNTSTNNLAMISGTLGYEGSYSKVTENSRTVEKRYSSRKSELIPFTEFLKKKV